MTPRWVGGRERVYVCVFIGVWVGGWERERECVCLSTNMWRGKLCVCVFECCFLECRVAVSCLCIATGSLMMVGSVAKKCSSHPREPFA